MVLVRASVGVGSLCIAPPEYIVVVYMLWTPTLLILLVVY